MEEQERARRICEFGTKPLVSVLCQRIKRELPRNMVQAMTETPTGAFAVGSFPCAFPKLPPHLAACEQERQRRVQTHGVHPLPSPLSAIDIPVNLCVCDMARTPYGAFATSSSVSFYDDSDDDDDIMPMAKAASANNLLSTSPTSVTASASVGDLRALVF